MTEECEEEAPLKVFQEHSSKRNDLRFWGVFTDGGCDGEKSAYWVDNVFTSYHWESFCSELGKDVHCIGMMVDDIIERSANALTDREYIIGRCDQVAAELYHDFGEAHFRSLRPWTNAKLKSFLVLLYNNLENGGRLGLKMLEDIAQEDKLHELNKLRDFVAQMEINQLVPSLGVTRFWPAEDSFTDKPPSLSFGPEEDQDQRMFYYDTNFTDYYDARSDRVVVGVIDSVTVSRHGMFSCPVSSGVLFVVQFGRFDKACVHADWVDRFVGLSFSKCSEQFTDLTNIDLVMEAIEKGQLSCTAQRICKSSVGEWVEFDSTGHCMQTMKNVLVKPVLWFRFYSKEEVRRQEPNIVEENVVENEDVDDVMGPDLELDNTEGEGEVELIPDVVPVVDEASVAPQGGVEEDDADLVVNHHQVIAIIVSDDETSDEDMSDDPSTVHTTEMCEKDRLVIPLMNSVGGNCVLLKLLDSEDRMSEAEDSSGIPNIDINAVILEGKKITLPRGIYLS